MTNLIARALEKQQEEIDAAYVQGPRTAKRSRDGEAANQAAIEGPMDAKAAVEGMAGDTSPAAKRQAPPQKFTAVDEDEEERDPIFSGARVVSTQLCDIRYATPQSPDQTHTVLVHMSWGSSNP